MARQNNEERLLKRLSRYFEQTISKYVFLVVDDERILKDIIQRLQEELKRKEIDILNLPLNEEKPSVYHQLKDFLAVTKCRGVIVTELNTLIYKYHNETIDLLNKARDAFDKFALPIVFTLNKDNLSKIINGASDLYQRRDLPDIHVELWNLIKNEYLIMPTQLRPDICKSLENRKPLSEEFIDVAFTTREVSRNDLMLMVGLEKQLLIALEKNKTLNSEDVVNDIAIPLLEYDILRSDYKRMRETYHRYIEGNEFKIRKEEILLDYHLKLLESGASWAYPLQADVETIAENEIKIRERLLKEAEWDSAAEKTFRLESYFTRKGKPERAMELLLQLDSEKISETNRIVLFGNLGRLNLHFGNYEKAASFERHAHVLAERRNDERNTAAALYYLGIIYQFKKQYDKALKHLNQSAKIFEDVRVKKEQAAALYHIGLIHEAMDKKYKGKDYFVRVSDIAGKIYDNKLYNRAREKLNKK